MICMIIIINYGTIYDMYDIINYGTMICILLIMVLYMICMILDRRRASGERSERDLSDRMAFWPAQLNAALRCMANSIIVLWLS